MTVELEPRALVAKEPAELGRYWQKVAETEDVKATDERLVALVHSEAIPVYIYSAWLQNAVETSPELLRAGLTDDKSWGIRKASIDALGRRFRSGKWKDWWDVLGCASGIMDLVDQLPQRDVQYLARAMAKGSHANQEEFAERAEKLLGLAVESDRKTGRLVVPALAPLVPMCSDKYVLEVLRCKGTEQVGRIRLKEVERLHLDLLRRIMARTVAVPQETWQTLVQSKLKSALRSRQKYIPVHTYKDMPTDAPPSMLFMLDFAAAISADSKLEHMAFVHGTFTSCVNASLRKAVRSRTPLSTILAYAEHVLPKYSKNRNPRAPKSTTEMCLINEIARWWSIARTGTICNKKDFWLKRLLHYQSAASFAPHAELLETLVVESLSYLDAFFGKKQDNLSRNLFFSSFAEPLKNTASELRLPLIKLICRRTPSLQIDLDIWPPSDREAKLMPFWDISILRALPSADGQQLFDRMLAMNECDDFLPHPIPGSATDGSIVWKNQCLLKIQWEREEHHPQLPVTRKVLAEAQQRAIKERDPYERLTWASSAVEFAIQSRSLDILADTVNWSKRYLRDPVVFPELLNVIFGRESAVALSCPEPSQVLSGMRETVVKVNDILWMYLEIVRLIVREPHYKWHFTVRVPGFWADLISRRIRHVRESKEKIDPELVDAVFYPLVPVLIDFERLALSEGPDKLRWANSFGVLGGVDDADKVPELILPFLDTIARKRDELRVEKRLEDDPDTATLPSGYPRGLALQHLLPGRELIRCAHKFPDAMPFVASRLAAVVEPSEEMLSVVPPEFAVKGLPVDELKFAVKSIIAGPSKRDNEKMLIQIWQRFSEALRAHPDQLEMFRNWLADVAVQENLKNAATVIRPPPARLIHAWPGHDSDDVVEWDPRGSERSGISAVESEPRPTILMCRLGLVDDFVNLSKCKMVPEDPLRVWRQQDRSRLPVQREAVALSALLYLDTMSRGTKRVLSRPWPTAESPRYPSIYLADEFLTDVAKAGNEAIIAATRALTQSGACLPAQLLRQVAYSLLDMLSDADNQPPNYSTMLSATVDLVKVVQRASQPQTAIDLVMRVIQSFPDASSYHRQMKLHKLGSFLRPPDAQALLQNFADYVCGSTTSGSDEERSQEFVNGRSVKVTTIKMLAQLLAGATFVPLFACLGTLQRLFDSSRHIDVRTEVVLAVMELFSRGTDTADVYSAFASMAMMASGPSERETISEADWVAMEQGEKPLPEVCAASDRPLLHLFVTMASSKLPELLRAEYVEHVLLPLLEQSSRQHRRWINCFLSQISLDVQEESAVASFIEVLPFNPSVINVVLNMWNAYLPRSYLKRHRSWAFAHLAYPFLATINEKLSAKSKGWKNRSDGKHWLDLQSDLRWREPVSTLNQRLCKSDTKITGGITIPDVAEEYIERAKVMVRCPLKLDWMSRRLVVSVQTALSPLTLLKQELDKTKNNKERQLLESLIERICADIKSLRTPQWIADPNRSPAVLPSDLDLELIRLPSPSTNPGMEDPVAVFSTELVGLVKKCAGDPLLLMEIDKLKAQVDKVKKGDLLTLVLQLGTATNEDALFDRLKIEIARHALCKAKTKDVQDNRDVMAMVHAWRKSEYEWLRNIGYTVSL